MMVVVTFIIRLIIPVYTDQYLVGVNVGGYATSF